MSDVSALKALSLETKALILVSEFEKRRMAKFQLRAVFAAILTNDEEKPTIIDLVEKELSLGHPPDKVAEFLNDMMSVTSQVIPVMNEGVQSTRRLRSPFLQNFEGQSAAAAPGAPVQDERLSTPPAGSGSGSTFVPRGQVYPAVPSQTMMLRNNQQGHGAGQAGAGSAMIPRSPAAGTGSTVLFNRSSLYPPSEDPHSNQPLAAPQQPMPPPQMHSSPMPRSTLVGLTNPNPAVIRSGTIAIRPDAQISPIPTGTAQIPQRSANPLPPAPQRRGTFVFDGPLANRPGGAMPPPPINVAGAMHDVPAGMNMNGMQPVLPSEQVRMGGTPPPKPGETRPTILIADDDKRIRMVFRLRMEESGLAVVECSDGTEAWERIQAGDIALAVLDMKMPGLHGLEVLSRMADKQYRIPVIVCSAYDQLKDEFVVQTYPNLKYLVKPVAPETLVGTIKDLLLKQ